MAADDEDSKSRETSSTHPARSAEQVDADEAGLQVGLAGVAVLVADVMSLESLLTQVAASAVQAIPRADGAGVTLLSNDSADTIVASAPFVREVDAIQYGLGEGPCISAAAQRETVRSGALSEDAQWPRFGPRVGRLGVHSVLSLPLMLPDKVVGAINVYAHERDAFDEHAQVLGELFAVPAAVAVHNAQVLAQARRVIEQLQAGLTNRAVIDQAIGILISRGGGTSSEAFSALRRISQKEQRKLSAVASQLVDDAARRARARHSGR